MGSGIGLLSLLDRMASPRCVVSCWTLEEDVWLAERIKILRGYILPGRRFVLRDYSRVPRRMASRGSDGEIDGDCSCGLAAGDGYGDGVESRRRRVRVGRA